MVDVTKKPEEKQPAEPITGAGAARGASAVKVGAANKTAEQAWDEAYKPEKWNESAAGRFAIRTFSRGLLGAMFFTAGGIWTRKMFPNADTVKGGHPYKQYNAVTTSLGDTVKDHNPLQFIAKLIDICAGKPIQSAVHLVTQDHGAAMRAVHFKPNKYSSFYPVNIFPEGKAHLPKFNPGKGGKVYGRSLGEEAVFLTFDFFMASIGDALGRDIAGWVDPAQRKEWMKELGDGKGGFKWPETISALGKKLFRYVTYNGGEDWAVALPYVYFVRGHRKLMNKISKGYQYESDISLNASSLKINTGATPHQVVGSYTLESIIDYQNRFTAYNVGTLMYREIYDKLEHLWKGEDVRLYGAPDAPDDPNRTLLQKTGDVLKWMARSTIKGIICMTPAVPFFSITRATQNRQNALFIDPVEGAALGFRDQNGTPHYIHPKMAAAFKPDGSGIAEHGLTANTPVYYARLDKYGYNGYGKLEPLEDAAHRTIMHQPKIGNPVVDPGFKHYKRRHNMIENFFSWLGEQGEKASSSLNDVAKTVDRSAKKPGGFGKAMRWAFGLNPHNADVDGFGRVTRGFVNASISYTPYMYMKAETARLWDTGKMDYALERLIDGAAKFDLGEVKAGIGETWNAFLHKPFEDKVRDAEGNRRIAIDTSQAADQTDQDAARTHQQQLSEQARMHSNLTSRAADSPEAKPGPDAPWYAKLGSHPPKPGPFTDRVTHKDQIPLKNRIFTGDKTQGVQTIDPSLSFADREDLRKVLENAQPLTNSIH